MKYNLCIINIDGIVNIFDNFNTYDNLSLKCYFRNNKNSRKIT